MELPEVNTTTYGLDSYPYTVANIWKVKLCHKLSAEARLTTVNKDY